MSLKTKFLNVMKACAYVQRLGENTFHRYKYATAADVFEKVNAALVEQGIISVAKPVIISTEQVTTAKGNSESRVTVEMTVTLTDAATGETMMLTAFGSGQDTGDKAVAAFTVAVNRRVNGQEQADFIPVVVWEKLAEVCC